MRIFCVLALSMTAAPGTLVGAQVQTEVPRTIPGAKPVTAERIKLLGADGFQNHVMPFFSRSLCFQPGCR